MKYKQQNEFVVIVKQLQGHKIGYKGRYSLRMSVYLQKDQKSIPAYCYLYSESSPTSSNKTKKNTQPNFQLNLTDNKQEYLHSAEAITYIQNQQSFYQTRSFFIRYETHSQNFDDVCIFKVERSLSELFTSTTNTRVCLFLQVLYHNILISNSFKGSKEVVHAERVYLNTKKGQLDNLLQIELRNNCFFGQVRTYVGSVHLGWKIRGTKSTIIDFLNMQLKAKERLVSQARNKSYQPDPAVVDASLNKITGKYLGSVHQFQKITVMRSYRQLSRLFTKITQLTSKNQLQTAFTKHELNFYQHVVSLDLNAQQQELDLLYEGQICPYFSLHKQDRQLCLNVKYLWGVLIGIVTKLDQFQFDREYSQQMENIQLEYNSITPMFVTQADIKNCNLPQEQKNGHVAYYSRFLALRVQLVAQFTTNKQRLVNQQQIVQNRHLNLPLLIVQNYGQQAQQKLSSSENTLAIFVQGFRGNENDLQLASLYLKKYNQHADILRIKNLKFDMREGIESLASKVAAQVDYHLRNCGKKYLQVNFICFSMGGIITRACLAHLPHLKQKLNILATFSTPHLGTYISGNNLVKAGIWYMINFNKETALQQLHTCRDLKTSDKSFLKRLSEKVCLGWFRKVVLVGCAEDGFVPHRSARVDELGGRAEGDEDMSSRLGSAGEEDCLEENQFNQQICQISKNIRRTAKKIERVEVWFNSNKQAKMLDRMTGRQSHIQFIENSSFLDQFFRLYRNQF